MSPLDRIAQLTTRAENAEKQCDIVLSNCESAQREVDLLRKANHDLQTLICELRAQVATARQELAREAGTIAKLAKDKRELVECLASLRFFLEDNTKMIQPASDFTERIAEVDSTLSRHA